MSMNTSSEQEYSVNDGENDRKNIASNQETKFTGEYSHLKEYFENKAKEEANVTIGNHELLNWKDEEEPTFQKMWQQNMKKNEIGKDQKSTPNLLCSHSESNFRNYIVFALVLFVLTGISGWLTIEESEKFDLGMFSLSVAFAMASGAYCLYND